MNYRSRVAAQRRASTRARLLESALLVYAEKGSSALIDDVIAQAGMARGSFYNYFRTSEELFGEVARVIHDELIRAIDPVVQRCEDPAERLACGTRMLLHAVTRYPLFGTFLGRLPFPTANSSLLGLRLMARDVALGIATRRFKGIGQRVSGDIVVGVALSAVYALAAEPIADYPEAAALALLRALGVEGSEAARLALLPLPLFELPSDSILRRTQFVPDWTQE